MKAEEKTRTAYARAGFNAPLMLVVVGFALLLAIAVRVSPADAAFIHPGPPSEAFGIDGTSSSEFRSGGVAVNPVSHRLYAFLSENSRIYAFETPTAGTHTAVGGNFPVAASNFGGFTEKANVAVDSGSGNFYSTEGGLLRGFNSQGEVLPNFPVSSGLAQTCGVSTDGEEHVWVADQQEHALREYTAAGELLKNIDTSSVFQPEFGAGRACTVAVDKSTGDLYFTLSPNYGANRIVWKLKASDNYAVGAVEQFVVNPTYPGISDIAIDSSRHVVYLAEGSSVRAYNTSGALLEEFATTVEPTFVAVDESTGIVYTTPVGYGSAERKIYAFAPTIVPDVETGAPSGDSQASGTVGTAGGPEVTECKFEWGPTSTYGEAPIPCSPAPPYGASQTVTADLSGLTKEQTYHYRVVAKNANGTNIGIDRTITPHNVPFLRTTGASDVERTCATLHGAYDGNGEDTHYNFEWGTTEAYGNKVFPAPEGEDNGSGTGPQDLEFELCNLTPATKYHFRVTGSNGTGPTTGNDATFTTGTAVIGLVTDPANEVSGVSAKVHGHWTGDGSDTTYYFEWGFSKNYGNTTPIVDAGSQNGPQSGTAELTGLFQNAVYHYRIVATDGLGTTVGADRSFRTLILSTFTYEPTTKLTTESAEVHATVNPENAGPTTYHFEYGLTESYGHSTPESGSVGSDNKPHPAAAAISGLSAGQTYHFRVVGTSPAGVSYGPDNTFTTAPNLPTVVSESVAGFSSTEASLTAEARPGFGPTVVFFRYGVEGNFRAHSLTSPPIGSDDSPHPVTLGIGNLQPGTTYEYFAVAVNLAGSAQGPIRSFTTTDRPTAERRGVSNVTETSATLAGVVNPKLAATTFHFEYGVGAPAGSKTPEQDVGSDNLSHDVGATVTDLKPGTTYQYVVVASNVVGTTTSSEGTFTTQPAPPEEPKPVVCKRGFVKRHGKCVRKPRHHRKKHHRKKHHRKAHRNG